MKIRLPPDLKWTIEKTAQAGRRSMNAEIIARLEESFAEPIHPLDVQRNWSPRALAQLERNAKVLHEDGRPRGTLDEVQEGGPEGEAYELEIDGELIAAMQRLTWAQKIGLLNLLAPPPEAGPDDGDDAAGSG